MIPSFDAGRRLFNELCYGDAVKTFPVVDRGPSAARRTTIFPVLPVDEFGDAFLFDRFQILLHAHPIIRIIPFFDSVDLRARVLFAFGTKSRVLRAHVVVDARAFREQIRALTIPCPAAGA
jgi:hypothetical protein